MEEKRRVFLIPILCNSQLSTLNSRLCRFVSFVRFVGVSVLIQSSTSTPPFRRTLEVSGKSHEFYCTRLRMSGRRMGFYPVRTTWHRAVFYCRLSLRESSVFSIFRRAKSDFYFPHDAWKVVLRERSTRHLKLHTVSHAVTKPQRRNPTSRFALRLPFLCALCGSLFVSIIDHE